ncbi:MAG: L-histidine N(alpha)-methyltransferase [Burkholderiaceae bacterium]
MNDSQPATTASSPNADAQRRQSESDHAEILAALASKPAQLPPKYFYDRLGSTLFTALCELPEYYPTRTEASIFAEYGEQIGAMMPTGFQMVDLGAGDCRKAAGLFGALKPAAYVGVDISGDFLSKSVAALEREFPDITMQPLVRDFTQAWSLPDDLLAAPLLYFYPGSSIGNFTPDEAAGFLERLPRSKTGSTSLLLGADLVKEHHVLEAAYDDALGVTGAFNRNALLVANDQLGTDFNLGQWVHRAFFNAEESRIEMHLVANQPCTVSWSGGSCEFNVGETIHTENSHKFEVESVNRLMTRAGFEVRQQWLDANQWYSVTLAQANN